MRTAYYNFWFPETYHIFAENYEPIRRASYYYHHNNILYCAQVHYWKNMNGICGALLRTCCTGAVWNNKLLSYFQNTYYEFINESINNYS